MRERFLSSLIAAGTGLGIATLVLKGIKRSMTTSLYFSGPNRPQLRFRVVHLSPVDPLSFRHRTRTGEQADLGQTDSEPLFHPHPYSPEIHRLIAQYNTSREAVAAVAAEDLSQPPPDLSQPFIWVDKPAQLERMIHKLSSAKQISVDVEHHNARSYYGITCLIQLSDGVSDYLVDCLALNDHMHTLLRITSDPSILKVLHSGVNDLLWLQKSFHLYLVNVFDCQLAAKVLGHGKKHAPLSLQQLLKTYCGITLDKSHALADWRIRPLPPQMAAYARRDVAYLLHLKTLLCREMTAAQLAEALRTSQEMSIDTLFFPEPADKVVASYSARMLTKARETAKARGGAALPPLAVKALGALVAFRDATARRFDESLHVILPDGVLVNLALHPQPEAWAEPRTLQAAIRAAEQACSIAAAVDPSVEDDVASTATRALTAYRFEYDLRYILRPDVLRDLSQMLAELLKPGGGGGGENGGDRGGGAASTPGAIAGATKGWNVTQFAMKRSPYENCKMLSQSGELLCFLDRKKANWYVLKGLADIVSDENGALIIRLNFLHRTGDQSRGSSTFYSESRANCCVGCGQTHTFLKYAIVPSLYRRHFPLALKSHRSHDIAVLCLACHERAQRSAEDVKRQIAEEMDIPLNPRKIRVPAAAAASAAAMEGPAPAAPGDDTPEGVEIHPATIRRLAIAYRAYRAAMPGGRREQIERSINVYLGKGDRGGLGPGDLQRALLAGLGLKSRRRMLQEMAASGEDLPADLLAELQGPSTTAAASAALSKREAEAGGVAGGHATINYGVGQWRHGLLVTAKLLEEKGEEGLWMLIRRFRENFQQTLRPRFLPAGWSADERDIREFGEFSVYHDQGGQLEAESDTVRVLASGGPG